MKSSIHKFDQLPEEYRARWASICEESHIWSHPFFRPDFTRLLSQARDDVEVVVLHNQDEPVGFFPFQRTSHRRGQAIGFGICDFQGVITNHPQQLTTTTLLQACRLNQISYDHWLTDVELPAQRHDSVHGSPWLDLSNGFDAFWKERLTEGASRLRSTARKLRKLERELGPVRITLDNQDPHAWEQLLVWKSAHYQRTNTLDVLKVPWIYRVLEAARSEDTPDLTGQLMKLHAGDRLLAVHFGLRSGNRVHWWFPTYDTNFSHYSPGWLLLIEGARKLAAEGCTRIDLGRGDEPYKRSVTRTECYVAKGRLGTNWLGWQYRRSTYQAMRRLQGVPGSEPPQRFRNHWVQRRRKRDFG